MSSYLCHAYQLLPGDACPEYAYRYRFLGQCLPEHFEQDGLGTAFQMLLAKCRSFSADENEVARWLSSVRVKWQATHFTGWDPRTGLAFRFQSALDSPAAGMVWQWHLEKPAQKQAARGRTAARW